WIWLPQLVQFWISNDGSEFKMVDELTHDIPLSKEESLTYEFKSDFKNPLKARYIKVLATNFGKCPSWHLGSGGDTWIFLDEISVN
ncbi:MAG: beta-N-acetylhexosaminidase, partial [Bacteroidota bacterium]|nr:beta-N-acetylhexosaminidase [Bacteroidota bacterium]